MVYTIYRIHPGLCTIDPMLIHLKADLFKIEPRSARLEFYPGSESYTEDKERIFICMKDQSGNYYPYSTLLLVALHELAHAFTDVIDTKHVTKEFLELNNELRQRAIDLGLLREDQMVDPTYCKKV